MRHSVLLPTVLLVLLCSFVSAIWTPMGGIELAVDGTCVNQEIVATVTNPTGTPVEGAVVTVSKGRDRVADARTEADGIVSFTLNETGEYKFRAAAVVGNSPIVYVNVEDCPAPTQPPAEPTQPTQPPAEPTEPEKPPAEPTAPTAPVTETAATGLFGLGAGTDFIIVGLIIIVLAIVGYYVYSKNK